MSSVHGLRLFRQIEICVLRHGSVSGALRRAPPASSGFVRSHRGQHLTPARWLSGSAAQSVQSVALRLNCQVGFIPHPEKAHKGGEDAFFVLTHDAGHGSGCGVADGVGGWAEQGVDSGEYSRALMKEAHRHLEEQLSTSSGTGASTLGALTSAYLKCTMLGSSTACLASLHRDQLETLNLGDSGFLLLRPLLRLPPMKEPGAFQIIHRTTEQAHRFNMPFQLGAHSNDLPEHGDRATFTVEVGDLLIMGTDGLWDNVFEEDILSVLAEFSPAHDPGKAASKLAVAAHRAGLANRATPFSVRAEELGMNFKGGKLDDVTVVVARVDA